MHNDRWTTTHLLKRGSTLIELMLAIALAALLIPVLLYGMISSREGKDQERERLQATGYMQEIVEAVRNEREQSWALISTNGTYYPSVAGTGWALNSGSQSIGGYTRQVVIEDVYRNGSGQIAVTGTLDPSTKKFTATVSWGILPADTLTETFYLTRYLGNTSWTQTTQADFDAGTKLNVSTTASGSVQLTPTVTSNWSGASLIGGYNAAGTGDANDVFVEGNYAYVVSNASTPNFMIVNISNPALPVLASSLNYSGVNINSVWVDNNIAYIGTGDNSREIITINVTNKAAPVQITSYNLGGNADVTGLVVSGGYIWATRQSSSFPEFQLLLLNGTLAGSVDIADTVNRIQVIGDTAYLATNLDSALMTIVNGTNKASPTIAGQYGVASLDGLDVYVVGTQAILTTTNNASGPEVYILNVTNPASITLTGSYNVGANVPGVNISGAAALLATELANKQFLVLNISSPATPSELMSINLGANSNQVLVLNDIAYVSSDSDTRELAIIRSSSTVTYPTSGTLTSSSFDGGSLVGFNYIQFNATKTATTEARLQIASNTDNSTWNYVGPDGTAATIYSTASAIPLSRVSGRYFRYQATLLGSGSATPLLNDVTLNYSP